LFEATDVPVRFRIRQLPLRAVLFALLLLCGLIPLALLDYLLISAAPRAGRLLETGGLIAAGGLLLAVLAWVFSGWAVAVVAEPARRLAAALGELSRGRFQIWVSPAGGVHEMAELSDELNRMSSLTRNRVRKLQQAERDSATLASDAMRLFQQAVQAKEPLTKHHPGLLEAYSGAVARQLGERAAEFESSEISLSPFIDPVKEPTEERASREQPRYEVESLMISGPVGARVLDVGLIGMGLETVEKLPLSRQQTFEIVARSRRLCIPGHIVWCRLVRTLKTAGGDQVPVFRAGVRFDDPLSIGTREELLEVIRGHRQVA
jgi:hypothetical protein